MRYRLFGFFTAVLLLLANITSASACSISVYQPKVPDSLKR